MNQVLVIIPAYNEEKNIVRVVDNLIQNYPQYDYVVINDGSKDRTAAICREHGYHLIDLPVNLGLAGAFQTGLKYADRMGYAYAIQFDADGQHRPGVHCPYAGRNAKRKRYCDRFPFCDGKETLYHAYGRQPSDFVRDETHHWKTDQGPHFRDAYV